MGDEVSKSTCRATHEGLTQLIREKHRETQDAFGRTEGKLSTIMKILQGANGELGLCSKVHDNTKDIGVVQGQIQSLKSGVLQVVLKFGPAIITGLLALGVWSKVGGT